MSIPPARIPPDVPPPAPRDLRPGRREAADPGGAAAAANAPAAGLARINPGRPERAEDPGGTDRLLLDAAVERANRVASIFNRRLQFLVHEETRRIMVRVINEDTQEVVAEIPPEKLLDAMAALQEAVGVILDEVV